jgi:hypothetical protein
MGSEASKSSREPGCLSFLKDISSSIDKDCYCEECQRAAETHFDQIDQKFKELGVRIEPTFESEELEDSWTDLGADSGTDSTISFSDESESLTRGDDSEDDEVILEIDLATLEPLDPTWYNNLGDGVLSHGSHVGVDSGDLQGSGTSNALYSFHM